MMMRALAWTLLMMGLLTWALPAWAHGGGQPQIVGGQIGPYRVNVWTAPEPPRVGPLHITIAVYQPGTRVDTPIADAQVRVTLTHEDGTQLEEQVPAGDAYPYYYEADFQVKTPGSWRVQVEVTVDGYRQTFTFSLEVQPANRLPLLWLLGAVALLLLGWWWYR